MKKRLIAILILIGYIFVLIRVMVFKIVPVITAGQVTLNFGGTNGGHPPNFVPFATILPYLLGNDGFTIAFLNIVGNIALLVPLGFLAVLVYPSMTWKKFLALGVFAGLAIETMQTVLNVGIFDIDDVILNALGVMVGFWVFIILVKGVREKRYLNIFVAAIIGIAAALGALYVMYPHDQQQVVSPGVGDLCNGTGGTGQIVSKGNSTITIKSKADVLQTITITPGTNIRNSTGAIPESDLKIGDHVTVVILDEKETASTVLVCGSPSL